LEEGTNMTTLRAESTARRGPAVVAFVLAGALAITGCALSRTVETSSPDPDQTHALPDGEAFYIVEGVVANGFIVDQAEFLTGEEANQAAVDDGVIQPGEDLPNDFYIRNDDESTDLVATAPDATFSMLTLDADGAINPSAMDYEDLVALMQGGYTGPDVYGVVDGTFPADVVIENGVIVQLGQVYLP
jgi:hypothetical protein